MVRGNILITHHYELIYTHLQSPIAKITGHVFQSNKHSAQRDWPGYCFSQASNNNISRVPDVLVGCSKLSKLDLEGNKLVTLSENMFVSWTMLTELNLDVASTEKFRQSEGPRIVIDLLQGGSENPDLLDAGFSVVAAGSAGNEVVKESFMELKVNELILRVMKDKSKSNVQSLYDAICVLLKLDDNRVVASQVYAVENCEIVVQVICHSM
ncbi:ARM repeat superfamily protein [Zea mays]|uniref:ARM repeat superfamily protein n=1 Tax=Zea mays TaxID=4577 RepID=A0A1D6ELU7_MAIZE|nr:ARM repeat superfamily protein [Zea mays]